MHIVRGIVGNKYILGYTGFNKDDTKDQLLILENMETKHQRCIGILHSQAEADILMDAITQFADDIGDSIKKQGVSL